MARYVVKLEVGDPFAITGRTFDGIPGRVTVTAQTLELDEEQVASLKGHGVQVRKVGAGATPGSEAEGGE